MSHLTTALRAATATALMGSFACLGTATATADPSDALVGSLSQGYTTSNCSPQAPSEVASVFPTVVAILQCGQNADSSGPVLAKYFLFSNATDLGSSFTKLIGSDTLTKCGDATSPTTWKPHGANDPAGQVACGTDSGQAEVIWTTDAKYVLAFVRGPNGDVGSLYQWWQAKG